MKYRGVWGGYGGSVSLEEMRDGDGLEIEGVEWPGGGKLDGPWIVQKSVASMFTSSLGNSYDSLLDMAVSFYLPLPSQS